MSKQRGPSSGPIVLSQRVVRPVGSAPHSAPPHSSRPPPQAPVTPSPDVPVTIPAKFVQHAQVQRAGHQPHGIVRTGSLPQQGMSAVQQQPQQPQQQPRRSSAQSAQRQQVTDVPREVEGDPRKCCGRLEGTVRYVEMHSDASSAPTADPRSGRIINKTDGYGKAIRWTSLSAHGAPQRDPSLPLLQQLVCPMTRLSNRAFRRHGSCWCWFT